MRRDRPDIRRRNDGDAGERNGNHGRRSQGIVVEVDGKRQSAGCEGRTTEDTSWGVVTLQQSGGKEREKG